jgi:pimeloyl-ACP methyl ester carboxylesterase
VVGVSWGGSVALWLAIRHPEVVRSVAVHEPPLFALLEARQAAMKPLRSQRAALAAVEADLESGGWEAAARRYVEQVAYEPGAWFRLSADARRRFIQNAPTYLDQCRDPDQMRIDLDSLGRFGGPVLITEGDRRTALFGPITERLCEALPQARRVLLPGAAHDPHLSDPAGFAKALAGFASPAAVG